MIPDENSELHCFTAANITGYKQGFGQFGDYPR